MTVYLLHFEEPIAPGKHTAQHYVGFADDLARRIAQHAAGTGSRLCEVAKERGIGFAVARTWAGGRELERRIKNRHEAPRLCPICKQIHADMQRELAAISLATVAEVEF